MKKVIILGGGIAGLASACFLAFEGYLVEVIEASPKLGGRAYSFPDKDTGCTIDNGQHIMMGCYTETLNFLKLIGAYNNVYIQKQLQVKFLSEGQIEYILKAPRAPYPFNLISGILRYKALSIGERLSLCGIFIKLPFFSERDLKKKSVHQWLEEEGESQNAISSFWEILCIGALNTSTTRASAYMFVHILRQIFLKGNNNSRIVLPVPGLTETYCHSAEEFIASRNGIIRTGETVQEIIFNKTKAVSVRTSREEIKGFDFLISTLPYYAVKKIIPSAKEIPFEYSPILSAHIVLRDPSAEQQPDSNAKKLRSSLLFKKGRSDNNNILNQSEEESDNEANSFYGLIGSPVHWIFNKGTHLTIVISNASELISKTSEELNEMITDELFKYSGIGKEEIISCKIIKEKRATFIPSNEIEDKRPPVETSYDNFYIAGDWVDTGLPSTLESAVVSARMAAEKIIAISH